VTSDSSNKIHKGKNSCAASECNVSTIHDGVEATPNRTLELEISLLRLLVKGTETYTFGLIVVLDSRSNEV
jgi:hypothetical protein